jgi:hypothetical protein
MDVDRGHRVRGALWNETCFVVGGRYADQNGCACTLKDREMARRVPLVDDLLHRASTSRARSVVTAAAVSFAICHFVVLATAPMPAVIADNLDAELPRQLVYCAAVLCRFAAPLAVMIVGMMCRRSKPNIGI